MSKTRTIARALAPAIAIAAALTCGGGATAAGVEKLSEGFDGDGSSLPIGWTRTNNSDGTSGNKSWFKIPVSDPSPGEFDAYAGDPKTLFQASFDSTTLISGATISNWLIGPSLVFNNGDKVSFFTRTATGSNYPDRLELRFGKGVNPTPAVRPPNGFQFVTGEEDLGDFTKVLKDANGNDVIINKDLLLGGYPEGWTQYTAKITGLTGPTTGKFAFRYYVTDSGQFGTNGNYVGVDSVTVTAVPEPAAYLMMALGLGVIGLRRIRATRG